MTRSWLATLFRTAAASGAIARRLRRGERGSATLIVTIVLGQGVLLGVGALVVDVGQIYQEREELVSGADAAALALALSCANAPTNCASQSATAVSHANANAKDGTTEVTLICGAGTGTGLQACPTQVGGVSSCLGATPSANYVEVRTATRRADGSTLLRPTFAQTLAGNSGYAGHTYHACARAAWGPPTSGGGLAIAVSQCNWQRMTSNGTVRATDEHVIYLHDPHSDDPDSAYCPKDPSGKTAPGGFGFLDDNAGTCLVSGSVPADWGGSPGNSSHGCDGPLGTYRSSGKPILLPIYGTVSGNGANTTYSVIGFASFVVTGWALSGTSMASNVPAGSVAPRPASDYCSGPDRCVYGWFTSTTLTTGTPGAGGDFGTKVIRQVG